MTAPIVVGIDESRHSTAALDWAMREAALHRLDLRLVHALLWYPAGGQTAAKPGSMVAEDAMVARRLLDTGLARGHTMIGGQGLAVSGHVAARTPATALLEAATHTAMVVVGSAGITGPLLGSVSLGVAARAVCPVVVVPQPDPGRRGERLRSRGVGRGRTSPGR